MAWIGSFYSKNIDYKESRVGKGKTMILQRHTIDGIIYHYLQSEANKQELSLSKRTNKS